MITEHTGSPGTGTFNSINLYSNSLHVFSNTLNNNKIKNDNSIKIIIIIIIKVFI